ncbi:MAG: DUF3380 domain-containing protein [Proteobacteria bacterium]|nr:MAG: DUF3380 domain-containing protein [Pseudomonadota bacterium]
MSDTQLIEFANQNNIDFKLLKAVIAVEAGGSGFNSDGSLKIRIEIHILLEDYPYMNNRWFKVGTPKYLDHYYKFPSYSNLWRKVHTGNQWDEYTALLTAAFQIQNKVFEYASFGKFQIMGFHYPKLGFSSALEMFSFMSQSDSNDTQTGLRFIKSDWNLVSALQQRDLIRFIKGYNGVSGNSVQVYLDRFNQEYAKL